MKIKNAIESILFISHKPLSIKKLMKVVGVEEKEVKTGLEKLAKEYKEKNGGIQLLQVGNKYQMATAGDSRPAVQKFIKGEMTGELTRPSLEALTIIAYRGPISKAELELIRGVNCSVILRNLLIRGLISTKDDKKRHLTMYNITHDFLKYLGISSQADLPDYEKLNRNNNLEKLLAGAENTNEEK